MRLNARVAIVTGAASGIGRATVDLFRAEGAHVVAVDRDAAVLEALAAAQPGIETCAGDVVDEDVARRTVDAALARHGRVDAMVTAAGISLGQPALTTSLEAWDQVFSVNAKATFLWAREALRVMVPAVPAARPSLSVPRPRCSDGRSAWMCFFSRSLCGMPR